MAKNNVVLDTNIWVSAIITRDENHLKEFITINEIRVYICPEMLLELKDVLDRAKFKKYLSKPIYNHIEDIKQICVVKKIFKRYNKAPDKDDNYLYDLCLATESILVTGDKLLLKHISEPPVETISRKKFFELY